MSRVTDPELLAQLSEGEDSFSKDMEDRKKRQIPGASKPQVDASGKVTDPDLLEQLNETLLGRAGRTAKQALDFVTGSAKQVADVQLGIAEQIPAGLGAMGEQALHGATALHDIMMSRAYRTWAGLPDKWGNKPFAEAFEMEYAALGKNANPVNFVLEGMRPETETGQLIFHKLGEWLDAGLSAVSDRVYERGLIGAFPNIVSTAFGLVDPTRESPIFAAGTKGAATLATIVGPVKAHQYFSKLHEGKTKQTLHEQMENDLAKNPPQFMEKYFPLTWQNMQAANIGKVRVATKGAGGVELNVRAQVADQLERMGLQPEEHAGLTLSEMIRKAIDLGDTIGEINPNARSAIVESFMERIEHLKKVEEATTPKLLSAPSPVRGTIEVTPDGRAATPAQRAKGRRIFDKLNIEQRAEVLGIGPMGVLRTHVESLKRAKQLAAGGEPGAERTVKAREKEVKRAWEQAFPRANHEQRAAVLKEWLDAGAPWEGQEILRARVYVRPKVRKGQEGSVDLEGLEDLATVTFATLERLPAAATLTRKQVEDVLKEPDIRGGEREVVQRVLNTFEGDSIPARTLAEKLGREAIPLELVPVQKYSDHGHDRIKSRQAGRGDDITFIARAPFKLLEDNHFSDPNYVAHIRGFWDKNQPKIFYISEVQSDLFQRMGREKPAVRPPEGTVLPEHPNVLRAQEHWINMNAILERSREMTEQQLTDAGQALGIFREAGESRADFLAYLRSRESSFYRHLEELRRDHPRPDAKSMPPESILKMTKHWYERILREFTRDAAASQAGGTSHTGAIGPTLRAPLGHAAATIESWPRHPMVKQIEFQMTDIHSEAWRTLSHENGKVTIKYEKDFGWFQESSIEQQKARIQKRLDDLTTRYNTWLTENNLPKLSMDDLQASNELASYSQRHELAAMRRTWDDLIWKQGRIRTPERFFVDSQELGRDGSDFLKIISNLPYELEPRFKGIFDFYEKDLRKFLTKEWAAKEVVDERGFKWMEWEAQDSQRVPMFGSANRQRGSIDLEGLEELPKSARQVAAAVGTLGKTPKGGDQEAYKRVEQAFEISARASELAKASALRRVVSAFTDKVADHQGTLKRVLVERGGVLGEEVVDRLNIINASTMRGKFIFEKEAKPIFDGLSDLDNADLSKIVRARVSIEHSRRHPTAKLPGGLEAADYEGWVRELSKKDDRRYQTLNRKADAVFQVYMRQLNDLFSEGLLSVDNYKRLANMDFLPGEYVSLIDPKERFKIHGEEIENTHSGVPYMRGGAKGEVVMDAKKWLAEHISRAQGRIMRNDAVHALWKLADANKDKAGFSFLKTIPVSKWDKNGVAQDVVIPDGYMKLTYMQDGKQRVLAIDQDLGKQWVFRPPAMDSIVSDVFRLASGSSLVKALATSYNPIFPIAGLPMDVAHLYLAGQGKAYSAHLPVFLGQFAVDLATVSKDAITKKGRFGEAMKEGLGFDFMTHEGKQFILHNHSLADRITPRWEGARKVLSWVNETQEIAVRLAHRERLIKSGLPAWEATSRARSRLDYSQGGVISKGLDTMVPYSNVAVQAWTTALREAKRDPVRAAGKMTWALSTLTGVTLYNIMKDPEVWQDIPVYDKINAIPIPIPWMSYVDTMGNKRTAYVPLRLDNTMAPLAALVVGASEKAIYGKAPDSILGKTLATLPSVLGNVTVPALDAYYQYTTNFDTRSDASIYSGIDVPPELEFKGPAFQHPTSEAFKTIGALTGGSPQRLERASRALLPNNPYISGLGWLAQQAFDIQPNSVRQKTTMELLSENQNLRRVVKWTHPAHREMNEIDQSVEKHGGKVKPLFDSVDSYVVQYVDRKVTADEVKSWLRLQPPELQQKLADRFKKGAAVEEVLRKEKAGEDSPSRVWWLKLSNVPAEVRAELFFSRWISASADDRVALQRTAQQLSRKGVGFASDDFMSHFRKLRSQHTDAER